MFKRRVVVTGLGIISPVGNSVAQAWENILAGKSGIGPITRFDVSAFAVRFGGSVKDFDPGQYINLVGFYSVDDAIRFKKDLSEFTNSYRQ